MKVRNGWVSNSSSSSFIISIKPEVKEFTIKIPFDTIDHKNIIKNESELFALLQSEDYEWWDANNKQELFDSCKKALDNGLYVFIGEVSNVYENDNTLSSVLYYNPDQLKDIPEVEEVIEEIQI